MPACCAPLAGARTEQVSQPVSQPAVRRPVRVAPTVEPGQPANQPASPSAAQRVARQPSLSSETGKKQATGAANTEPTRVRQSSTVRVIRIELAAIYIYRCTRQAGSPRAVGTRQSSARIWVHQSVDTNSKVAGWHSCTRLSTDIIRVGAGGFLRALGTGYSLSDVHPPRAGASGRG